jgi:hypothetical protein
MPISTMARGISIVAGSGPAKGSLTGFEGRQWPSGAKNASFGRFFVSG